MFVYLAAGPCSYIRVWGQPSGILDGWEQALSTSARFFQLVALRKKDVGPIDFPISQN
jgi:hypothetical protein